MTSKEATMTLTMNRIVNLFPLLPVMVYSVKIEKIYKSILVTLPVGEPPHYYVFPSWHPVFYADGKLKLRIAYTPGGRAALSEDMMNQYKDAWYQIEEKRVEISQRLLTGRLILDKAG